MNADRARITEPEQLTRAEYQSHEGRIQALESFMDYHQQHHDDVVATREWVLIRGYIVAGVVAMIASSLGAAAVRALIG